MPTISELSGISISSFKFIDGIDVGNIASIDGVDLVTETLLLDTAYGSGAEAAYSVRKLRAAYKGAAIQVQRTVGSFPTQEIGFDVNGNLDTATLLAYASGNEVGVSIWYDQSLNLNNAVQISVALRPIVVAAGGALVEIDGRAAMTLDGSNDAFTTSSNIVGAYSIFTLGNPAASGYYADSTSGDRQYIIRNAAVAGSFSKYQNGTATSAFYGFEKELVAYISNSATTRVINTLLSRYTKTESYNGDFSEYIIYTSDKSGTDQTSIEENVGDYYTQNQAPYLLDTYTGAAAAYSLRKLRTDYTGFAIKVQDNVGGATQTIGFNVFGELDTVSLAAYAGSNDVFVVTWFNQSGGSLDMTPISSSNRGQIVVSGVVNTNSEGKVFIDMKPSQYPLGASISQPFQIVTVWKAVSDRRLLNGSGFDFNIQSDKLRFLIGSSITGSTNINNAVINLATASVDSGAAITRLNGNVEATGTIGTSPIPSNAIVFSRLNSTNWGPEESYEFIIFDSVQSDITGIETNINTFYDIY
jgi:hypothetical protein